MVDTSPDRRAVFDELFAENEDPWDFATSHYEIEKRRAAIDALGSECFENALEIGSATGILSAELLPFCNRVLGVDVSGEAVDLAIKNYLGTPGLLFERRELPDEWPTGQFDLIVLSEILYFMSEREIVQCARRCWQTMPLGGVCLIVNWTGHNDLPVVGDEAVKIFTEAAGWSFQKQQSFAKYRIDIVRKKGR